MKNAKGKKSNQKKIEYFLNWWLRWKLEKLVMFVFEYRDVPYPTMLTAYETVGKVLKEEIEKRKELLDELGITPRVHSCGACECGWEIGDYANGMGFDIRTYGNRSIDIWYKANWQRIPESRKAAYKELAHDGEKRK